MPPAYTQDEILSQLGTFPFPVMDDGWCYTAAVRLSAYRDDFRWALVIEQLVYLPQSPAHGGILDLIHAYGNCIKGRPGVPNYKDAKRTADGPDGPTFVDLGNRAAIVRPGARTISVRGQTVAIEATATYAKLGVMIHDPNAITPEELLRAIAVTPHRSLLLATEAELRKQLKADVPLLLRLDEWHHPDGMNKEGAAQSETFQMIAEVLATGDKSHYRPSTPPNTHWSNWPRAGGFFRTPEAKAVMASLPPATAQSESTRISIMPPQKAPGKRVMSIRIFAENYQFRVFDETKDPFRPMPTLGEKESQQGWTRNEHSIWYFTAAHLNDHRIDVFLAEAYVDDNNVENVLVHNLDLKSGVLALSSNGPPHTTSVAPGHYVVYYRAFNRGIDPAEDIDDDAFLKRTDFERYELILVPGRTEKEGRLGGTQSV